MEFKIKSNDMKVTYDAWNIVYKPVHHKVMAFRRNANKGR